MVAVKVCISVPSPVPPVFSGLQGLLDVEHVGEMSFMLVRVKESEELPQELEPFFPANTPNVGPLKAPPRQSRKIFTIIV